MGGSRFILGDTLRTDQLEESRGEFEKAELLLVFADLEWNS